MEKLTTHLEFIQSSVARMNQCSFQMKGWMVTIVSALLALFASSKSAQQTGNVMYLFVAIVPTTIFWLLDSYYLQQERKFRGIYNNVAKLTTSEAQIIIKEFEMPMNKFNGGEYAFCKVMFSKTEWTLYLPIIVGLAFAGFVIK